MYGRLTFGYLYCNKSPESNCTFRRQNKNLWKQSWVVSWLRYLCIFAYSRQNGNNIWSWFSRQNDFFDLKLISHWNEPVAHCRFVEFMMEQIRTYIPFWMRRKRKKHRSVDYLHANILRLWYLIADLVLRFNSCGRGTKNRSSTEQLPWKYIKKNDGRQP